MKQSALCFACLWALGALPLAAWSQSEFAAIQPPATAASAVAVELGEPPTLGESAVPTPSPASAAVSQKARMATSPRVSMVRPAQREQGEQRPPHQRLGAAARVSDAHTEHVVFRRLPITVMLPLQRERLLSFPAPVQLDLPESVMSALKVSSVGRTTYLYASKPIPKTRVIAQELAGARRVYVVDVLTAAKGSALADELEIHNPSEEDTASQAAPASGAMDASEIDMVQLTRYAAQMVYAPTRLLPSVEGIHQTPVSLTPLPGLIRAARVMATPIGAWRSGALTVTAVKVSNVSPSSLALNLGELRGKWVAASAQHADVGPAGSASDTTVLYLICDGPFEACR